MTDTPIADTTFAAVDFESAGAKPGETDVPIQIGIAVMGSGLQIHRSSFHRSYIAPGRKVTWAASKIHGITTADLEGAPSLFELWPEIKKRLGGSVVVSHAAATEKRFLRAFPLHGFRHWVDSLTVARAAYPSASNHSLGGLVDHLELGDEVSRLCPDLQWHDALYDAVASLVLLRQIISETRSQDQPVSLLMRPDLSEYYKSRFSDRSRTTFPNGYSKILNSKIGRNPASEESPE